MFVGMIGFLCITWLIPEGNAHGVTSEGDTSVVGSESDPHDVNRENDTVNRENDTHNISSEDSVHDTNSDDTHIINSENDAKNTKLDRSLEMTGLITALGISLHNFPEGLVVFNATVVGVCDLPAPSSFSLSYVLQYLIQCTGRGLVVALAIAIHNIPEGIAVTLPLYYSTHSKWEAMKWCLLSSICEPLAAIIFGVLFSDYLTERIMAIMNAVVAGIMIILCVVELIPTALKYTSAKVRFNSSYKF